MEDNKDHHRHHIRLYNFDYSSSGVVYFITIVVDFRKCLLADPVTLEINKAGEMVSDEYRKLSSRFQSYHFCDFVIMPNHIHFITVKGKDDKIPLYNVIKAFKSITTNEYIKGVKAEGWEPFKAHFWQRNYYEHIIRNERSYNFIRNYIFQNPSRWINDKLNPDCDMDNLDNINARIKELE